VIGVRAVVVVLMMMGSVPSAWSQASWNRLSTPTKTPLRSLSFVDSLTGWVAGREGVILKTSNGGASWETQHANPTVDITQIFMLNERIGWTVSPFYTFDSVFTFGTHVHKTVNGGTEWVQSTVPDQYFYTIGFIDSLTGAAAGGSGAIYRTTDGGATWTDVSPGPAWPIHKIRFYSPRLGLAVGGRFDLHAVAYRSIDECLSWDAGLLDSTEPIFDVTFTDSMNAIGVGGDPEVGFAVARTSDAGVTWSYDFVGMWGIGSAIAFRTPMEAWVPIRWEGITAYTPDAGRTWLNFQHPDEIATFDVQFLDSLHGYMVGDSGLVLKYQKPTVGVVEIPDGKPTAVHLMQNYPNPFNPSTVIGFQIPVRGHVTLTVYDVLGRAVATLIDEIREAGSGKVVWNASGLPSGVYICRLQSGGLVETKKLVLTR
jgi:photosystem II stability/assembly factor-like uncharacterized protein